MKAPIADAVAGTAVEAVSTPKIIIIGEDTLGQGHRDMFDRVSDLSASLTGETGSAGEVDSEVVGDLLRDDETVVHVLANGGSVEHTTDGRTTTVEAEGDHGAYVLATDERVVVVLGDQPGRAEIDLEMEAVTGSRVRSGLLNSELVVQTDGESVAFAPDAGDLDAAADYVDRVGSCWADMADALAQARAIMDDFESALDGDGEPNEQWLRVKSQLSQARHSATREDEAPTRKMQTRIGDVTADLERRRVSLWLDRAEAATDRATAAADSGEWGPDTLAALVEASDAIEGATRAVEEVDAVPDGADDRLAALSESVDDLAASFLDAQTDEMDEAREEADDVAAADRWGTVADRYRAALDAGWDGLGGVAAEAIGYELAWVDAKRLRALTTRAEEREAAGDEAEDDDARERYDEAADLFERAREVAAESDHLSADPYAAAAERVADKRDATEWEWGDA